MISFRYHIVSIVSVFLALAVGIALGGGPLKGEVDNSLVKELAARKSELATQERQLASLNAANKFSDAYATTSAGPILRNKLAKKSVAIITLPDADHDVEAQLGQLIAGAGGAVTGTFSIGSKLGGVANRNLVEELTTQMLTSLPGLAVEADSTGYERLGALLSRAIVATPGATAYDSTSVNIMAGLSTAGLISADAKPTARADVVLVLAGPPVGTDLGSAANTIHARVLAALSTARGGVVLAGPAGSARAGGVLRVVRDDVSLNRVVTTVDSTDTGAGRVVSTLALARRLGGTIAAWGAIDAEDGPMPVVS